MPLSLLVALLLFVGLLVFLAVKIGRAIHERETESDQFLQSLSMPRPEGGAKNDYDAERKRVFDANREKKRWELDRLEEDLNGDPSNAWHRELEDSDRTALRSALMKRTISNFPLIARLPPELNQKAQLYQRGLLAESQWRSVLALRDWLQEESVQIRHEAECLQEKWGFEGTIFQEAAGFHQHLARKQMEMAQEQLRQRSAAVAAGISGAVPRVVPAASRAGGA
ncbi:preprotein translocase subunit Sec66 [Gregarina niphandrodes]|uniref:Preprotein translocase subunit Sec66 n=1 Tax=Gregarina niphandrodes TaxID=110365 RepID=A0A023B0R8_GRENI|nr:preprotein translocase subunit Sec66 [Gregarina niphandrodes]EZG45889.1 preprotein translocase subunit Sec66 [Gregarina niphandrodes]|eukprot:XP_011132415.1 preprotein translocase subunit Sec66 [Gregarina niphandrodes]